MLLTVLMTPTYSCLWAPSVSGWHTGDVIATVYPTVGLKLRHLAHPAQMGNFVSCPVTSQVLYFLSRKIFLVYIGPCSVHCAPQNECVTCRG